MERASRTRSGFLTCNAALLLLFLILLSSVIFLIWENESALLYYENFLQPPSINQVDSSALIRLGYETLKHKLELDFIKLHSDWNHVFDQLQKNVSRIAFRGPSLTSCFLWVPQCYHLAKDPIIAKTLAPILGPDIVLYGIQIWKANAHTDFSAIERFNLEDESGPCFDVAKVAIGGNVRILEGSHLYTDFLRDKILKRVAALENVITDVASVEHMIGVVASNEPSRASGKTQTAGFVTLRPETGTAFIIHGKSIYRLEATFRNQVILVLQYASNECSIRYRTNTPNNLVLPPVLLISGSPRGAILNDVRNVMIVKQTLSFSSERHNFAFPISPTQQTISFYDCKPCRNKESKDECIYGSLSTSVFSRVFFEYSNTLSNSTETFKCSEYEQLIVMLNGHLFYRSADKKLPGYTETSLLEAHSATRIPKGTWHAMLPASEQVSFISVKWRTWEIEKGERPHLGFSGVQRVVLHKGQAYDPGNENDCDVIVVIIYGNTLQILPSEEFIGESESLFIKGDEPCLLWNVGITPVALVSMQACKYDQTTTPFFSGDFETAFSFGAGGRIMRK